MLDYWSRRDSYKSLKIYSSTRLVTYDFLKDTETLSPLPKFKKLREVNISDGFIYCLCKFRYRYGIDCPHVYHVVSQTKNLWIQFFLT